MPRLPPRSSRSPPLAPRPLTALTNLPTDSAPSADSWDGILANLRSRYPGQKDSVLFCLYKLQGNPKLGLPDFRDEAALHGIRIAGRALHSARVLLGLAVLKPPALPKARREQLADAHGFANPQRHRVRRQRAGVDTSDDSIETKVLHAVQQIQSSAAAQADELRAAVREAISILQRAVGD